jgi:hypothetical protein
VNIDALGGQVKQAGLGVLAAFLVFILLTTLPLIARKCCAGTFRFCQALFLVVLLLVFVFAGMFLLLSMVSADVCYAPTDNIMSIVSKIPGPEAATLGYYMTCDRNDTRVGAIRDLDGSIAHISNAQYDLGLFRGNYSSLLNSTGIARLDTLNDSLISTRASLVLLSDIIGCAGMNRIYQQLLLDLCKDGTYGLTLTWGLATAACCLMFFMAMSGARLCWRHPGDPVEKDKQRQTAPQPADQQSIQMQQQQQMAQQYQMMQQQQQPQGYAPAAVPISYGAPVIVAGGYAGGPVYA